MPRRKTGEKRVSTETQQNHKKIVRNFFKLVVQGRQKEGLSFFAADCRQHNPYVHGGMDALFDAMAAAQKETPMYPDPYLAVRRILADGDYVAAHTELFSARAKPSEGGLRQAHLFRFNKGGKIVEYWDITQQVNHEMPNAANAF